MSPSLVSSENDTEKKTRHTEIIILVERQRHGATQNIDGAIVKIYQARDNLLMR